MKRFRILLSDYNKHLESAYGLKLINRVVNAEIGTNYIHAIINEIEFLFAINEVEEIIEAKKTNKTKIINSIKIYDNKNDKDIKEVMRIKRLLRNRTVKDIESIKYAYEQLIKMYYHSNIQQINFELKYILKDSIKLILDSSIELDNIYELQMIRKWIELGIN